MNFIDVLTRINVWQLEGEKQHNSLLKFALNGENIHKSVIVITLDFSKPWDLVQSLKNRDKHWSNSSSKLPKCRVQILGPQEMCKKSKENIYPTQDPWSEGLETYSRIRDP